jgi:hypothetical protein
MLDNISDGTRALVVSYMSIRRAIGMIGLALPILLGPVGYFGLGIEIQDNISSYYHTPMRDIFVGAMCSIGIFLFCYRGYDWIERWTGYIGCSAAMGVALFPLDENSDPLYQESVAGYLHTICGGAFFLTLAFYSLYHFPSTRRGPHKPEKLELERNLVYRTSGVVILLSLLAMGSYLLLFPTPWKNELNDYNFLFWMEWVSVWSFAAAWLTKGRAIFAEIAVDLMSGPVQLLKNRFHK